MTAEMMILPELASLADSDEAPTASSSEATLLKTAPEEANPSQTPGSDGSNDSAEPR
jgi:hypothetical protein